MDASNCIIHYDCVSISRKLHQITFKTLKNLKKNKVSRIALGGNNLNRLQSAGIPETLDKNYYVLRERFKKFTLDVSIEKERKRKNLLIKQNLNARGYH